MKNILVPTDFGEQAEKALQVAAQLAHKFHSEIYLLHMLELPMMLIDPMHGSNQNLPEALFFMKLAHQRFTKLKAAPYLQGLKVHETVQFHRAFEGIMEISREKSCDLIVMGSHGASGYQEMFIGSNTEKVVRNSEIPVLVIKNEMPDFRIENFVFATDGTAPQKNLLSRAVAFAMAIEAPLHLLYINTPNDFLSTADANHRLLNFSEEYPQLETRIHIYNDMSVEEGILNYARKQGADLLGIGTHGRKGLAHFFNGSISEDLVNHANRPVVTFRI